MRPALSAEENVLNGVFISAAGRTAGVAGTPIIGEFIVGAEIVAAGGPAGVLAGVVIGALPLT